MVVVAVDQMRRSEIDQARPHFTGGFRRLLSEGARLDGHYGQQNTYTGPGHALIMSGSYGYLNGIFQNNWFNRATGRSESMLFDEKAQVINQGPVDPGEDSSPRNFYGSTVGDELRMSNGGKSKVVSLAVKERGALLLGGRTGTAYLLQRPERRLDDVDVLHERAAALAGRVQCEAPRRSVVRQGVDSLPARGGLRSRARRRSVGGRSAGPRPDLPAQDHRQGAEADRQVLGGLHDLGFRHRSHLRVCARRRRGRGARPGRDHRHPRDLGQPDRSHRPRVWHLLARGQRLVPPHRSRARRVLHVSRQSPGQVAAGSPW